MSQSNDELVREAVAAIGPWRAFLHAKRAEVEAQIAQLQATHGAEPYYGVEQAGSITPMSDMTVPFSTVVPPADDEGATEEASGEVPMEAESPTVPHSAPNPTFDSLHGVEHSAGNADLIGASELEAEFEAALREADRAALPLEVVDALEARPSDPGRFARAVVAAQRRGALPDRLSVAAENLGEVAPQFVEARTLYDSGQYPELFEPYDPYDTAGEGVESDSHELPDASMGSPLSALPDSAGNTLP